MVCRRSYVVCAGSALVRDLCGLAQRYRGAPQSADRNALREGLVAGRDFTPAFSGAHDNSILGVANKDYDAAAIANSVKSRMIDRGVVSEDQFNIIYRSDTFPTTGYGVAHNLTPELQDRIREAFFSFEWEGTSLQREFERSGEAQFIPITFKDNWSVIREIDAAMGVQYTCN